VKYELATHGAILPPCHVCHKNGFKSIKKRQNHMKHKHPEKYLEEKLAKEKKKQEKTAIPNVSGLLLLLLLLSPFHFLETLSFTPPSAPKSLSLTLPQKRKARKVPEPIPASSICKTFSDDYFAEPPTKVSKVEISLKAKSRKKYAKKLKETASKQASRAVGLAPASPFPLTPPGASPPNPHTSQLGSFPGVQTNFIAVIPKFVASPIATPLAMDVGALNHTDFTDCSSCKEPEVLDWMGWILRSL